MMAYGEAFMSGLIPRDPSYPPYALASGAAALRIAGAFTFLQAVVCNTLADASAKGNLVKSTTYKCACPTRCHRRVRCFNSNSTFWLIYTASTRCTPRARCASDACRAPSACVAVVQSHTQCAWCLRHFPERSKAHVEQQMVSSCQISA